MYALLLSLIMSADLKRSTYYAPRIPTRTTIINEYYDWWRPRNDDRDEPPIPPDEILWPVRDPLPTKPLRLRR